jgi:hypothetical protein
MSNKPTAQWKSKYNRRMSTALLYCGTPEGFVIGADSRGFNKITQQVETDKERKIFAFENSSASVVFAWAGTIKARTSHFDFSLLEESKDILPKVNFQIFDEDFNARLRERLSVLRVDTTGKCAHGIFLYFWKGSPMGFELSVFKNGRTWDSCIIDGGTPSGEIIVVSSGVEPADFDKPRSLNQAKSMIEHYIQDCIADPRNEEIGGDVHIGKLTSEGFDWMVPPKAGSF